MLHNMTLDKDGTWHTTAWETNNPRFQRSTENVARGEGEKEGEGEWDRNSEDSKKENIH